eukprot:jgi/Ulvmu1/6616/UM003_0253.1
MYAAGARLYSTRWCWRCSGCAMVSARPRRGHESIAVVTSVGAHCGEKFCSVAPQCGLAARLARTETIKLKSHDHGRRHDRSRNSICRHGADSGVPDTSKMLVWDVKVINAAIHSPHSATTSVLPWVDCQCPAGQVATDQGLFRQLSACMYGATNTLREITAACSLSKCIVSAVTKHFYAVCPIGPDSIGLWLCMYDGDGE